MRSYFFIVPVTATLCACTNSMVADEPGAFSYDGINVGADGSPDEIKTATYEGINFSPELSKGEIERFETALSTHFISLKEEHMSAVEEFGDSSAIYRETLEDFNYIQQNLPGYYRRYRLLPVEETKSRVIYAECFAKTMFDLEELQNPALSVDGGGRNIWYVYYDIEKDRLYGLYVNSPL